MKYKDPFRVQEDAEEIRESWRKRFMRNKIKERKWLAALVFALLWLLLCAAVTPVYTTVTLTFAEDPSGEVITTVYAGPGNNVAVSDARSRVINSGTARISWLDLQYQKHCSLKRIDPLDQSYDGGTLTIEKLTVRKNGLPVISLEGQELRDYFTGNDQVVFSDSADFTFSVTGEDPQLLPTQAFQALYTEGNIAVFLLGYLGSAFAVLLLAFLVRRVLLMAQDGTKFQKISCLIFLAGILGAVLMCVYTGLRSPFWLNPDEYDVKAAVLYYFEHFLPPDIRSDSINDSYPVYGTSRHFEFNLFYFYAGKLGQFFADAAVQLRLFSLLLFGLMAGITIKNIRKNYALLFVFLLTPQVWYIFSYSTSDALDFFMGFLCLYELVEKNSMLNRLLRDKFQKRHLLYYGVLSLLFLHIFWAKATFYTILMFLFLILLIRLLFQEKTERGPLFRKYLILVGLTLGLFAVRYLITDFPYYGFDKLGVIMDVTERQAEYGYKPSTPAMEAAYSMRFFEKGISLWDLLTKYEFHKNLFRTFAGFFGSYAFGEADWYYIVMGILYLLLIGRTVQKLWSQKKAVYRWETAAAAFTGFLQYAMIVGNSWFVDFQPQGRYLLPVLFFAAYLISRVEHVWEDKVLRVILVCTCILSLYCFWHVGLPNLVPDRVILP